MSDTIAETSVKETEGNQPFSEPPIVVYEPNQRAKIGYFHTLVVMFRNMIAAKELIMVLYKRDLFAQYKKSFIGYGWLIITPFLGILSWVFMNATGVLAPGDVGIPYPAYVLVSTSIYGLFGTFIGAGSGTLSAGSGFINQVNYPHEALMLKQVLQSLTSFLSNFVLIIVVLVIFEVVPSWQIIFFPVLILPFLFLGVGIGLVLSVISVVATDITRIFNMGIGFLMYLTPVIYAPKNQDPLLQTVIMYNPLTYIIETIRGTMIYGKFEYPLEYGLVFFGSFLFFTLCLRFFYLSEQRVIEKML